MIVINDYNPAWPTEFEVIRLSLLEILGPLALRIDHIGSTSVPGLGAKDVIDIQITVEALAPEVRHRLIEADYEYWAAITQDHVPLGEDDDPKLWAKFLFNQPVMTKGIFNFTLPVCIFIIPGSAYFFGAGFNSVLHYLIYVWYK